MAPPLGPKSSLQGEESWWKFSDEKASLASCRHGSTARAASPSTPGALSENTGETPLEFCTLDALHGFCPSSATPQFCDLEQTAYPLKLLWILGPPHPPSGLFELLVTPAGRHPAPKSCAINSSCLFPQATTRDLPQAPGHEGQEVLWGAYSPESGEKNKKGQGS